MKLTKWIICAAASLALGSPLLTQTQAGLFKMDFGTAENERVPVDADGNPTGEAPGLLKDWDSVSTWTFADFPDNKALWKLTDFSTDGDSDVTLTIIDNVALSEKNSWEPPVGMIHNNPTHETGNAAYDGVVVPPEVRNDYLYRNPDTAGSELLFRFANLNPGTYNVTVFEGRTTDAAQYGKIWVDDIEGKKAPAEQNTGSFSGKRPNGEIAPLGQPRTVVVTIKAGEYLWYAHMEDNSGGISGIIIRSASGAPPVDVANSPGLFKIDFGHFENERKLVDAEGNPTGDASPKLNDWVVIPTWTFAEPNANVTEGSESTKGTANAGGTEVTWKLIDASNDGNKNVTMTIMDNATLTASLGLEPPTGQIANNPTKDGNDVIYDGVLVPAAVKDDYNYRAPDTASTELLMRFAGLKPGSYNVTVFEGRTTDNNGRYGKVWVDDITGKKEPAEQNTGNYAGVNLDIGGVATPVGNPRTVAVTLKEGEYLWFAEMEDNSGGISGMIIRGTTTVAPSVQLLAADSLAGTFTAVPSATIDSAAKSIKVATAGSSKFFRVKGSSKINSVSVKNGTVELKYQ